MDNELHALTAPRDERDLRSKSELSALLSRLTAEKDALFQIWLDLGAEDGGLAADSVWMAASYANKAALCLEVRIARVGA